MIFFVLGNVFRTVLCLFVVAVDVTKLESVFHFERLFVGFIRLRDTIPGMLVWNIAKAVDWRLIAAGSFLVIYSCLRKGYTGEAARSQHNSNLFLLILSRGYPFGSSGSGSTNVHLVPNLSLHLNYEVHFCDSYPGHCHP